MVKLLLSTKQKFKTSPVTVMTAENSLQSVFQEQLFLFSWKQERIAG